MLRLTIQKKETYSYYGQRLRKDKCPTVLLRTGDRRSSFIAKENQCEDNIGDADSEKIVRNEKKSKKGRKRNKKPDHRERMRTGIRFASKTS